MSRVVVALRGRSRSFSPSTHLIEICGVAFGLSGVGPVSLLIFGMNVDLGLTSMRIESSPDIESCTATSTSGAGAAAGTASDVMAGRCSGEETGVGSDTGVNAVGADANAGFAADAGVAANAAA